MLMRLLKLKGALLLWLVAMVGVLWLLLVSLLQLLSTQPQFLVRLAQWADVTLTIGTFEAETRPFSLSLDFHAQNIDMRWAGGELHIGQLDGDLHLSNLLMPDLAVGKRLRIDQVLLTLQTSADEATGLNLMDNPWLRLWEDTQLHGGKVVWQADTPWQLDAIEVRVALESDWQARLTGVMSYPGWQPFPITAVANIQHRFGFHPQLAFQAQATPTGLYWLGESADLALQLRGQWQESGLQAEVSASVQTQGDASSPVDHYVMGTLTTEDLLDWQWQMQALMIQQQQIHLPVWPTLTLHPQRGAVLALHQIYLNQDAQWLAAMPEPVQQWWRAWQPELWLNQLSVHWGQDGALDAIRGGVDLVRWQPQSGMPGMTLKQLTFDFQPKDGRLTMVPQGGSEFSWQNDQGKSLPITASPLVLRVNPERLLSDWNLPAWHVQVGDVQLQLSADVHPQQPIALLAQLKAADVSALKTVMPWQLLSVELQQWLQSALVSGQSIEGQVAFHGLLSELLDGNLTEQNFAAQLQARAVQLRFDSEYPPLHAADVQFRWLPDRLRFDSQQATISGAKAQQVVAEVVYLPTGQVALRANGVVQGRVEQVKQFLLDSPLAKEMDAENLLKTAVLTGPMQGRLSIWLPLDGFDDKVQSRIRGMMQLMQVDAQYDALTASSVQGKLLFSETGLYAHQLGGNGLGGHLKAQLNSLDRGRIRLRLQGTSDVDQPQLLTGKTQWQGEVLFDRSQDSIQLQAQGDEKGLTLVLPLPAQTLGDGQWRLQAKQQGNQWQAGWQGSRWQAKGMVREQGDQWQLLGLQLADKATSLPKADTGVSISLPSADLLAWLDWWQERDDASSSVLVLPESGLANIHQLTVADQQFAQVELSWQLSDKQKVWLKSSDLQGQVTISDDFVQLHLNRLRWQRKVLTASEKLAQPMPVCRKPSTGSWPKMRVQIDQLQLDTLRESTTQRSLLRNVQAQVSQQAGVRQVQDISVTMDSLHAKGGWQWHLADNRSRMQWVARAEKAPDLMALWGLSDAISGGSMSLQADVGWTGGMDCFDARLWQGSVAMRADDGALADTSPGLARLFGLLSFDAFTKRLKIGLDDVVNKGLAYDKIEANGQLDKGMLHLEQLSLIGPSVKMELQGDTDLMSEEHQLNAKVTPLIGDSIPTMALLSGASPITAIGVYLLQKIVPPLSGNLFTFDYRIRGSWQAPVFEDVQAHEAR